MPGSSVIAGPAHGRGAGTQNTLGHTVASLGIRPARLCKRRARKCRFAPRNDGFANPVPRPHAGTNNSAGQKHNRMSENKKSWTVYIVKCANGALYTGITNNLAGRIADHNAGRGAKYTAAFGPVELVWKKRKKDRSAASVLEAAIKKLSRAEKDALISVASPKTVK